MTQRARLATSLLSIAAIGAIIVLLIAGATGGGGAAAAPESPCGAATDATYFSTAFAVALRISAGERNGTAVRRGVRTIEADRVLANAVAANDLATVRSEVLALVYNHQHIVRLRVLRNGRLLDDYGGPLVLVPVSGSLRVGGVVVGTFVMSIQDDLGYQKLAERLIGAHTVMRYHGQTVMRDIAVAPAPLPARGTVVVGGVPYLVGSFDIGRFPAGTLRVSILVHRPPAALARSSCAQVGADVLADIAERERLWYHIDAAYAGFAVLTERGRALLSGIERADSVTLDPHKWLYVPFECGCLMVRDPSALEAAFHILPDYLKDVEAHEQDVNFADSGEQLTRYSRAFKVWVSVNYFGLAPIREAIDRCMQLADHAERLVHAAPDLEVLSPAQFGVVCFRVHPHGQTDSAALDALNERVNSAVNESQRVLMSSTRLRGGYSLRLCILNYRTTEHDINTVIDLVRSAAANVQ